jgi:putative flippase GtrA
MLARARSLLASGHSRRLPLFLAIGLVALGATNAVLAALHGHLGVPLVLAAPAGWEVGLLVTFTLNSTLTWRNHRTGTLATRFGRYQAVALVGAAIYLSTVFGTTSGLKVHYLAASLLGSAAGALWNYTGSHALVFRARPVRLRPLTSGADAS